MWITQPTYVVLQSVAIILSFLLLAAGFFGILLAGTVVPFRSGNFILDLLIIMFWGGLLALPTESVEMIVMLRKFTRVEAEQRARLAALDVAEPAPAAPSSTAVQLPPNIPPSNTNIQP